MKKLLPVLFLVILIIPRLLAQSGLTWNPAAAVAAGTYGNKYPRITLDRQGNPMLVWGKTSTEAVFFSRWNGTSFATPVKLNPSWMTVATATWMGPDIASHGDTVYVVVKRTPESSDTNRMFLFRSFDGGISFNAPVEFGFIADSISRFPTVTTDANGHPIISFMKFDHNFLDSRWVVLRSNDYGTTFSIDTKASGWAGSAEVCDCCPGAITSSGNTCAVLYRNNDSNIRDNWAGISTNNGVSFTTGFAVDNNNWMVMSCPASGPDGVIVGDTLYSVFMSGAGGSIKNYFSRSSISAGSMASITNLSGTVTGITNPNYPRIATDGQAMAMVWRQNAGGSAQLPLRFTSNIANGFPTMYDTVDLADITNTDVAVGKGKVWVVWEDDIAGTINYRMGQYGVATGLADAGVVDHPVLHLYPNPAHEQVRLVVDHNKDYVVHVYNMQGKEMITSHGNKTSNLDIRAWATGVYRVVVQTDSGIQSVSFLKQ